MIGQEIADLKVKLRMKYIKKLKWLFKGQLKKYREKRTPDT